MPFNPPLGLSVHVLLSLFSDDSESFESLIRSTTRRAIRLEIGKRMLESLYTDIRFLGRNFSGMTRSEERSHNRRSVLVSTRGHGNNSGPVLDAIGDDLTRIVPLFARWIYEDRCPATGTPVAVPAKRRNSHYAITIFTGASFYN